MTLRISDTSLAFAIADKTAVKGVAYETYTVRSGISIAANLREAFRQSQLVGIMVVDDRLEVTVDGHDGDGIELGQHAADSAEFNRAPITEIKGIALDVVTLYMRGR